MNVAEKKAMADNWPNFDIFADKLHCQCDHCADFSEEALIADIPDDLFYFIDDTIQPMRTELGFALPINSAYRCEFHPDEMEKSNPGPHQLCAADVGVSHKKADKALALSYHYPRITGRGVNQKGPVSGRYLHFDPLPETIYRPRPHLWTY